MNEYQKVIRNKAFVKAVESLQLKAPVAELSDKLSYDKGNISRILRLKLDVSDRLVQRFEDVYNIKISDYETEVNMVHEPIATEYKADREVPLYDVEATAGVVSLFRDPRAHTPIDTIKIPNMPSCDGAVAVTGDSMYPLIKSGDIVLYKTIENIPESVFFGNMYLVSLDVEGDEMVMVKYVHRGRDEDHILLVSENKHHADKEVHIRNINGMALVKASVRFNSLT